MLFTAGGLPLLGHSEVLWRSAVALTLAGLPLPPEPAVEIMVVRYLQLSETCKLGEMPLWELSP